MTVGAIAIHSARISIGVLAGEVTKALRDVDEEGGLTAENRKLLERASELITNWVDCLTKTDQPAGICCHIPTVRDVVAGCCGERTVDNDEVAAHLRNIADLMSEVLVIGRFRDVSERDKAICFFSKMATCPNATGGCADNG